MKTSLQITLDGLVKALKGKAHHLAETIEDDYRASGRRSLDPRDRIALEQLTRQGDDYDDRRGS